MRSALAHEENRTRVGIKGVLRASRSGICELSRNSNSGLPRMNGKTSKERATATSALMSWSAAIAAGSSGKEAHDMASLLMSPFKPSVRNPPRDLIMSRSPRR